MLEPLELALVAAVLIGAGITVALARPAWIVDFPRTVLALVAAVTAGAIVSFVDFSPLQSKIGVDPSSEPLLPTRDPGQPIYRKAVLDFGTDDIYVIAMETENVFTKENLDRLQRISDRVRRLEGVRRAQSLVGAKALRYAAEEDAVDLGDFIREVPTDPAALESLRARALSDSIYQKTIISEDGRTAALNVTFEAMTDGEFVDRDLDGRILRILEEESSADVRFYVAGRPHVRTAAHHIVVRDLLRLIPVAVAVGAVTLLVMTGSLNGVLIPLVSCLLGTTWMFGGLGLVGMDMNVLTMILAPIMICVGSVYGVHVIARYEQFAPTSESARSAALETLEYTRTPVLIAGFTTCVGFAALMLADVRATNELGAFCVLGVASVAMLSITGVPAALALFPLGRGGDLSTDRTDIGRRVEARVGRLLEGVSNLCTGHPTRVLVLWAAFAAGAIYLIPKTVIDTDYLTFFNADSIVRTDFAAVNRLLSGAVPIYVLFNGTEEGTFREPDALLTLQTIQSKLERIPGVSHVLSSVDLVRRVNRAMGRSDPKWADVPATRPNLAEVLFMIPKEDLRPFSTSNHSSANLIVRTGSLGSAPVRELEERILAVVAESELPPGVEVDVTGNTILMNRSSDGIANNQFTQVGSAALTILILIWIVFRSFPIALLSMAPNMVPVLLFFGVLGAGAAPLSLPTALIGSIALGIAIDDTVHFLVSYLRLREAGATSVEAADKSIRTVGRPIIMTSIMLVIGFLVMLGSGFATIREFGYLTAMTMAICLTSDVFMLPALLVRARA